MSLEQKYLSIEDAAILSGCPGPSIERLVQLGLLPSGGLTLEDINAIRLLMSFEGAGIGLPAFAHAAREGVLSLAFTRDLLPDTILLSGQTFGGLCSDLGLDFGAAVRLFVASGLPAPDPPRYARQDEVILLQLMAETLKYGISEHALIGVLRVFGQATRRVAEAMRDRFRSEIEPRLENQGLSPSEVLAATSQYRNPLKNIAFQALRLLSARFLEDMTFDNITMRIQNILSVNGLLEPIGTADPTVAFVDLAGYSALTRESGDHEAAQAALQFEAAAHESAASFDGRIIKSLADGLLILFLKPANALEGCIHLMKRRIADRLPEIHAGLTVGPVIRRDGDIFGNSVNLAARLASLAAPSEIVADARSIAMVHFPQARWRAGGVVTPKGMDEVTIFRLTARPL